MTTKCEHPNHHLKASSQSKFCFSLISGPKVLKKSVCILPFSNCSKESKNCSQRKHYLEINNLQTCFCVLNVNLATVQIACL